MPKMCHGYAFLAFSSFLSLCRISNLHVVQGREKFESHPGHQMRFCYWAEAESPCVPCQYRESRRGRASTVLPVVTTSRAFAGGHAVGKMVGRIDRTVGEAAPLRPSEHL